jgi:SAM-dependent methyltransferase
MRLSPALIALLLGCLSAGLSLLLEQICSKYLPMTLPELLFLIIQGLVAALLARALKLAIWWQWILFIFPLAIWLALKLDLTPSFLFGGFLIFVLMYWSVFLTQVPYYPSGQGACDIVAKLIDHQKQLKILEIGSGLGGFSIQLAKIHPNSTYMGIEIAPLPFLISLIRSKYQGSKVSFKLGNYEKVDFAHFDLVFAYLSPAAMPKLYEQCKAQMKPGSVLVSHEFNVPGVKPSNTLESELDSKLTYLYQIT